MVAFTNSGDDGLELDGASVNCKRTSIDHAARDAALANARVPLGGGFERRKAGGALTAARTPPLASTTATVVRERDFPRLLNDLNMVARTTEGGAEQEQNESVFAARDGARDAAFLDVSASMNGKEILAGMNHQLLTAADAADSAAGNLLAVSINALDEEVPPHGVDQQQRNQPQEEEEEVEVNAELQNGGDPCDEERRQTLQTPCSVPPSLVADGDAAYAAAAAAVARAERIAERIEAERIAASENETAEKFAAAELDEEEKSAAEASKAAAAAAAAAAESMMAAAGRNLRGHGEAPAEVSGGFCSLIADGSRVAFFPAVPANPFGLTPALSAAPAAWTIAAPTSPAPAPEILLAKEKAAEAEIEAAAASESAEAAEEAVETAEVAVEATAPVAAEAEVAAAKAEVAAAEAAEVPAAAAEAELAAKAEAEAAAETAEKAKAADEAVAELEAAAEQEAAAIRAAAAAKSAAAAEAARKAEIMEAATVAAAAPAAQAAPALVLSDPSLSQQHAADVDVGSRSRSRSRSPHRFRRRTESPPPLFFSMSDDNRVIFPARDQARGSGSPPSRTFSRPRSRAKSPPSRIRSRSPPRATRLPSRSPPGARASRHARTSRSPPRRHRRHFSSPSLRFHLPPRTIRSPPPGPYTAARPEEAELRPVMGGVGMDINIHSHLHILIFQASTHLLFHLSPPL